MAPSSKRVAPTPSKQASHVEAGGAVITDQASRLAALEASLSERYVIRRAPARIGGLTIGQTQYRFPGDQSRLAFTESMSRLSTDANSPTVIRSMVDVAESRKWGPMRISGSDDFKRMVWLEASLRRIRTVGYDLVPGELDILRKERESGRHARTSSTTKQSGRGGGRKTVLAALETVLVARGVPLKQREAVLSAAAEGLAHQVQTGEDHRFGVDPGTAVRQRSTLVPTRVIHKTQERTDPVR